MISFPGKKSFLALIIFVVFLSSFILLVNYFNLNLKRKPDINKVLQEKEAILIIKYDQNRERWFKGEVIHGMTIKEALRAASISSNLNFLANSHLAMIDGVSNNKDKKWNCYVNDVEVREDIDKKPIFPKDKILCVYK